jgi:hypothetical protein
MEYSFSARGCLGELYRVLGLGEPFLGELKLVLKLVKGFLEELKLVLEIVEFFLSPRSTAWIELSEYRISYWRIQETLRLSDIGSGPQSMGYRIWESEKTMVAHPCC